MCQLLNELGCNVTLHNTLQFSSLYLTTTMKIIIIIYTGKAYKEKECVYIIKSVICRPDLINTIKVDTLRYESLHNTISGQVYISFASSSPQFGANFHMKPFLLASSCV